MSDTPRTDSIVSGLKNMLTRFANSHSLPEKFSQVQATLIIHSETLERELANAQEPVASLHIWAAVSPDNKVIAAPFDTEKQVRDWAEISVDEKYRLYRPVKFYATPPVTSEVTKECGK